MAKFMVSLRDENFQLLVLEARRRGISIQELLRAVVIPEWTLNNGLSKSEVDERFSLRSLPVIAKEREVQTVFNRVKG